MHEVPMLSRVFHRADELAGDTRCRDEPLRCVTSRRRHSNHHDNTLDAFIVLSASFRARSHHDLWPKARV